ncbi:MAG: transposase [Gemmatimonadota bacterium]
MFHLTARTLRKDRWFTPNLRSIALRHVALVAPRSGARLLAVAIMSNHLHLVIQQGEMPLSRLMQPLLRRLAGAVQHAHGLEGPVFWRHYASTPCLNPWHARNAIAYVHLNPVRAGLCTHPDDYDWTSHPLYAGATRLPAALRSVAPVLDPAIGLRLFAATPVSSLEDLRTGYLSFLRGRMSACGHELGEVDDETVRWGENGSPPKWGSPIWTATLSPLFHSANSGQSAGGARPGPPDMGQLARVVLAAEAPDLSLAAIRGRGGGREYSRLRSLIIHRLHAAGYRNSQIAPFIGLSESGVWHALQRSPGR